MTETELVFVAASLHFMQQYRVHRKCRSKMNVSRRFEIHKSIQTHLSDSKDPVLSIGFHLPPGPNVTTEYQTYHEVVSVLGPCHFGWEGSSMETDGTACIGSS